jgi:hypothetical protein
MSPHTSESRAEQMVVLLGVAGPATPTHWSLSLLLTNKKDPFQDPFPSFINEI